MDGKKFKSLEFFAAAKLYDVPIILISLDEVKEFAAYTKDGNQKMPIYILSLSSVRMVLIHRDDPLHLESGFKMIRATRLPNAPMEVIEEDERENEFTEE